MRQRLIAQIPLCNQIPKSCPRRHWQIGAWLAFPRRAWREWLCESWIRLVAKFRGHAREILHSVRLVSHYGVLRQFISLSPALVRQPKPGGGGVWAPTRGGQSLLTRCNG